MQKKSDFDRMCAYFYEKLSSSVKLFFSLQTNAILVDSEWINLFSKHNVGIGVSIDGPKEYNDLFRVDHRKRGTYDRVFKGLQILNEAATAKLIKEIGLICVVNPDHDGQKIYRHFIDVLKVSHLDFLLPDLTHDLFEGDKKQESYSRYLTAIFYEWLQDDNPNVEIRLFNSLIKSLTNVDLQRNYSDQGLSDGMVLVISSNGDIAPDDVLKNTQVWTQEDEINVRDTSLKEYLEYKTLISIQASKLSSPSTCKQCCWENICKGGSLIHRFSKENGFNNASVFCNTLKNLYSHIANYLLSSGVTLDTIKNILRLA